MSKTITMYATVAFDYRGAKIQKGQPFQPQSAADAVVLKNRKQADFRRPASPAPSAAESKPSSTPVPPSSTERELELETSALDAGQDGQPPQGDARARTGSPRGQYRRRDLRADA